MKRIWNHFLKILFFSGMLSYSGASAEESSKTEKSESSDTKMKQILSEENFLSGSFPDPPKELSLEYVLKSVEKSFSLFLAAEKDRLIAENELLAAEGSFDGTFRSAATSATGFYDNQRFDTMVDQPTKWNGTSFFAGYRIGRGSFPVYDGKLATNSLGEVRAGAKIPLWRDVQIDRGRAGIRKAEIGVRIADLSIDQQKIEIFRNASQRYWDWVAAGLRLKVTKDILEIAKKRDVQIRVRVKAGELPAIEITENERVILQREAQVVSAEQIFIQASNEVSLFLRQSADLVIIPGIENLPGKLPGVYGSEDYNSGKGIETASEKRPELARFKAQKDQNLIDVELAKNQTKPGVDLVVSASQDLGTGSETRKQPEMDASIVFSLPLQTRTQKGRIGIAKAQNAKLEEQEKFVRDRIAADVKNANSLLDATSKRIILVQKETESTKKLQIAEKFRYEVGESTLFLLNLRKQASLEAEIKVIEAQTEHQ
ncbi:MAG: TolC family protein, partial [Leptospira sp.]|nr:TolC family protein [Leptospira sp.]